MTITSPLFVKVYICCNSLASHCHSMLHRLLFYLLFFMVLSADGGDFKLLRLTIFSNVIDVHDILPTFLLSLGFTALLLLYVAALT